MDDTNAMITVSDVLEYMFCPRFIFYMYCLTISQYEGRRFKVQTGRDVHEKKRIANPDYFRKKLGVCGRCQEVYLSSETHHIKAIVDDVLTFDDGTMGPFEYKFSEFKGKVPETYEMQLAFQALLIQEVYHSKVTRGYICFVRSQNVVKEVPISEEMIDSLAEIVQSILSIIQEGYYPKKTIITNRCDDCTYRKICV